MEGECLRQWCSDLEGSCFVIVVIELVATSIQIRWAMNGHPFFLLGRSRQRGRFKLRKGLFELLDF